MYNHGLNYSVVRGGGEEREVKKRENRSRERKYEYNGPVANYKIENSISIITVFVPVRRVT